MHGCHKHCTVKITNTIMLGWLLWQVFCSQQHSHSSPCFLLFHFCSFKSEIRAFFVKVVVEKDNCVSDSEPNNATCIRRYVGRCLHFWQARRSLTRWCDMVLLITSVRPRLEFTGAYPPFIMPMIKTRHAALDGNWWWQWQALWMLICLWYFLQKLRHSAQNRSESGTQTVICLWYMYFLNENGLQTIKQLCLDLLETCVCACMCVLARLSMRPYLCLHVSLCVCLCIIAPSHSNYKMHLIHFLIEEKKNISTNTLSLC